MVYYLNAIMKKSSFLKNSKRLVEKNACYTLINADRETTFNHFFRRYYAALCFFAQSVIHNEEEAKDIVQHCFMKFWDHANNAEKATSVKSFLYMMVRNQCIDYVRKQKVIQKTKHYFQNNDNNAEYFDEIAFAETVRIVLKHMNELSPNMNIVLKKYYLQGKKHKEIASELLTSEDAVRMQKTRAIKLLKQKLLSFSLMLICILSLKVQ